MKKSPQAFRTISEVAEALDIPAHVLRFWESRFPQLRPMKSSGGRRYYRPDDVDLLRGIRDLLYHDGMTIKGVQKIFREQGQKAVAERGRRLDAQTNSGKRTEAEALWDESDLVDDLEAGADDGAAATDAPADPSPGERRALITDAITRLESVRSRILRDLDD
ncbi:MAG: MerR family transcriptional regulator [Pseudomonadota bacterium]